jgi:RimJ/RimL family protein N-acetyltransferase
MYLGPLYLCNCLEVLDWRNQHPEILRTSYYLTPEMQTKFYNDAVCSRSANSRFWSILAPKDEIMKTKAKTVTYKTNKFIGMAGLEKISPENSSAEISVMLGNWDNLSQAVKLILDAGFNKLNLENIYTEVYTCNPYLQDWLFIADKYRAEPVAVLPRRKYWDGKYYDSYYISFNREYTKGYLNEDTAPEPVQ